MRQNTGKPRGLPANHRKRAPSGRLRATHSAGGGGQRPRVLPAGAADQRHPGAEAGRRAATRRGSRRRGACSPTCTCSSRTGMMLLDVPAAQAEATLARLEQFLFSEDVKLGSLAGALDERVGARARGRRGARAVARRRRGAWRVGASITTSTSAFAGESLVLAAIDQLGGPGLLRLPQRRPSAARSWRRSKRPGARQVARRRSRPHASKPATRSSAST